MNDHELDMLIAVAVPVTDAEIDGWDLAAPLTQLCEAIMSRPVQELPVPEIRTVVAIDDRRRTNSRPRRWRRIAALTTAAAAIAGGALVIGLRGESAPHRAWAAPLVQFARSSPLLLLNDPQWLVTYADEYAGESPGPRDGEMRFTNAAAEANLYWRSGPLAMWLDDRLADGDNRGQHRAPGGSATIVQYTGANDFTALWVNDGRVLEFRAQSPTLESFGSLLDGLTQVDVDRWLSAMPTSVINSADQRNVITDMLNGIPLPHSFDASALTSESEIKDRYQLGVRVVSTVSCAWIAQWIEARTNGDTAAEQSAEQAMSTSSQWPIIIEMNKSGAYGEVLQAFADGMASDSGLLPDSGRPVSDEYKESLGCGQ